MEELKVDFRNRRTREPLLWEPGLAASLRGCPVHGFVLNWQQQAPSPQGTMLVNNPQSQQSHTPSWGAIMATLHSLGLGGEVFYLEINHSKIWEGVRCLMASYKSQNTKPAFKTADEASPNYLHQANINPLHDNEARPGSSITGSTPSPSPRYFPQAPGDNCAGIPPISQTKHYLRLTQWKKSLSYAKEFNELWLQIPDGE